MSSTPNKRKAADAAAVMPEKKARSMEATLRPDVHPQVGDVKPGLSFRPEQVKDFKETNVVETKALWTPQKLLHARLQAALPCFDGVGGILGIISSYAQGAAVLSAESASRRSCELS